MCDTILCDRCHAEADTDLTVYTNNYDYLCESCHEIDESIRELDGEICTILDLLEERPHNYTLAVDLKRKQDELKELIDKW